MPGAGSWECSCQGTEKSVAGCGCKPHSWQTKVPIPAARPSLKFRIARGDIYLSVWVEMCWTTTLSPIFNRSFYVYLSWNVSRVCLKSFRYFRLCKKFLKKTDILKKMTQKNKFDKSYFLRHVQNAAVHSCLPDMSKTTEGGIDIDSLEVSTLIIDIELQLWFIDLRTC